MTGTAYRVGRQMLLCLFAAGCTQGERGRAAVGKTALDVIDSVRVQESDSQFIARPVDLLVGARGHYFISDVGQSRVTEVEPGGGIVRQFGQRGGGPGEFMSPSWLATDGDTLLLVKDPGKQTIETFRIATGAYVGGRRMVRGSGPLRVRNGTILLSAIDLKAGSGLTTIARDGAESFEGSVPPIVQRFPMLLSAFYNQAFAVNDSVVYAIFEMAPGIFRWTRGSHHAEVLAFPRRLRRGVNASDFETMVREPAKATALAYRHSIPMRVEFASPSLLAIAMYDVDLAGQTFTGRYFVSFVDLSARRVCADLPVPAPNDPPARVTFVADTVVVIQQALEAGGKPATAIRRFKFDRTRCDWQPLQGF